MRKPGLIMTAVALPLLGLALYRCSGRAGGEPVIVHLAPQPDQPRVPAEEAGIAAGALDAAMRYAAERDSSALVVGHGGHIVFEKYWGDTTFATPVETGFEPALAALSVGTALSDRLVHNLDEPLSNYIAEAADPEKAFTLRELLARDRADVSLEESADLLAWLLERVTSQPYQALVAQRLWSPLGGGDLEFRRAGSERRPEAVSASCCLRARLGDWMRVGELLANQGVFEGNQLMPPHYVDLMLKPTHQQSPRGYFTRVDGAFATHDVAWLEGTHKQRLWIVPSLRLVILRLGGEPASSKGWDEAMIPDTIIRGTSGWHPSGAGAGVDPNKFAPH